MPSKPVREWHKGEIGVYYRQCSYTDRDRGRCTSHSVLKFYSDQGLTDIVRYRCGGHPVKGWSVIIVTTPEYKLVLTKKEKS